jgi:hypothetical protein
MKTKWMKANISGFLGIIFLQIMDILKATIKKPEDIVAAHYNLINKVSTIENFEELDEETYNVIRQAIKEYNKTGDIKKDFIDRFGIDAWNDMKVKY